MISKSENTPNIINDLETFQKTILVENPDWMKKIRKRSLAQFEALGFPTVKDEDWKYTNILPLASRTYNLIDTNTAIDEDTFSQYYNKADINIVFINGQFSKKHSTLQSLPQGLSIQTFKDASKKDLDLLSEVFKKYKTDEETAFVSLNKAFNLNGTFIRIEKKKTIEKPIHIIHATNPSTLNFLATPRTVIIAEESSELTILETHISMASDPSYLTNALTDIFLNENSVLHYTKVQNENINSFHIGTTRVWQERNSNFQGFSLMTGASITRNDLDIVLNGEGSNGTLNGLYLIGGKQLADNHTSVDHLVPNCTSNQLYKGILKGASHAVFNGKIFVRDIAQQTNSYQLNKNLIMGKDCRVDTKPQLEIFADDVKCTHGATIGQLNPDELFYLQTRSIPKRDAIQMLSRGFVEDLLNCIERPSIREKLAIFIEPQLTCL